MLKSFIYSSYTGVYKQENQDNLLIAECSSGNLFVIFDGVGSAKNSKLGTDLAKEFIVQNIAEYQSQDSFQLNNLMFDVNSYLCEQTISDLYTTYCALFLSYDNYNFSQFSSLGDSRIYSIHPQYLEQLSEDDKLHSNSNIITKCLGMYDLSIKDFKTNFLSDPHHKILLCTDGFYNLLEDDLLTFFDILISKNLNTIRRKLDAHIDGRNRDDSTYILIDNEV